MSKLGNIRETLAIAKRFNYLNEETLNKIEEHINTTEKAIKRMSKKKAHWYIGVLWIDIFLAILDNPRNEHRQLLMRLFKVSAKADATKPLRYYSRYFLND